MDRSNWNKGLNTLSFVLKVWGIYMILRGIETKEVDKMAIWAILFGGVIFVIGYLLKNKR